ncbi:MAG TPA: hypothetical protein VI796_02670 [Candidatus Thermoplasmatota archaeon]|nr:hypothetical protein [Candidatus Thermoplasmatota archaeon]
MFDFDPAALHAFFQDVPRLYRQAQAPVHEAYQSLLYRVHHPLKPDHFDAVEAAFGLPHPSWNAGSREEALRLLDALRYPEARPFSSLRAVAGLDLRSLSHHLHFIHHAYPIYDAESCKGLERLGVPMPFVKVRDPDTYGLYVAAVEELKERIPYWSVLETNVYLTRIVQGALHGFGTATALKPGPHRAL